jgi:hypothetical protein
MDTFARHPMIYLWGNTEEQSFPLILVIGREPNFDQPVGTHVGKIDVEEFKSMSGGRG